MQLAAISCARRPPPSSTTIAPVTDDRRAGHQRGRDAQRRQRAWGERVHHVGDERRQRALVGVPPREMITCDEEVELVTVIAIAMRTHEEDQGDDRAQHN